MSCEPYGSSRTCWVPASTSPLWAAQDLQGEFQIFAPGSKCTPSFLYLCWNMSARDDDWRPNVRNINLTRLKSVWRWLRLLVCRSITYFRWSWMPWLYSCSFPLKHKLNLLLQRRLTSYCSMMVHSLMWGRTLCFGKKLFSTISQWQLLSELGLWRGFGFWTHS